MLNTGTIFRCLGICLAGKCQKSPACERQREPQQVEWEWRWRCRWWGATANVVLVARIRLTFQMEQYKGCMFFGCDAGIFSMEYWELTIKLNANFKDWGSCGAGQRCGSLTSAQSFARCGPLPCLSPIIASHTAISPACPLCYLMPALSRNGAVVVACVAGVLEKVGRQASHVRLV